MATFDMTSSATAGVNSNSIAALPAKPRWHEHAYGGSHSGH